MIVIIVIIAHVFEAFIHLTDKCCYDYLSEVNRIIETLEIQLEFIFLKLIFGNLT